MELNKRFLIDLSQAQSPADIVFELSNIIEKEDAANKKVWLKLGSVTLNQSQLLSINSLISSINSTLSLVESDCPQTELAAATLGINTKDVEEEIQEELSSLEAEAPKDAPSEQYIPMTDHEEVEQQAEQDIVQQAVQKEEMVAIEESESTQAEAADLKESSTSAENNEKAVQEADSEKEEATETVSAEVSNEQENEEKNEEIQSELDSIFDSETKLENILSDDKDITSMQNWPLTKEEGDDFEMPEDIDVMTDEDYAILQMNTQYHKQTVRSGQVIKSNGNVVIIGDCHPGCEIHAAGDITVWGILGGIAHAGCNGNTKARIRALNLNAIQLRIADSYARRPDHIKNIYVEKSNSFIPEEARNVNGNIVILKMNDK